MLKTNTNDADGGDAALSISKPRETIEADLCVIGAGSGGLSVAAAAAAFGRSVVLLEKDRDVGMPVRCGEAVSNSSLEKIVDIDPRWIAATCCWVRPH